MKKIFVAISILLIFATITAIPFNSISANRTADSKPAGNVMVDFDGLQGLFTGNPDRVSTAILNVPHHTPELIIKQGEKTLYSLKNASEIGTLTVAIDGGQNSVSQYRPSIDNQFDWRHTLDLEGDVFQKQLHVKPGAIAAKIHFTTGVFFGDKLSQDLLMLRSGSTERLRRRVALPAAAIDLQPGQVLTITGNNGKVAIRLPFSELGYQISVHNLPPVEMSDLNHFYFYYSALSDRVTEYEPVIINRAAFSPRPLVCNAVIFSISTLADTKK